MKQELAKIMGFSESYYYSTINAQINESVIKTVNSGFKNSAYINLDNPIGAMPQCQQSFDPDYNIKNFSGKQSSHIIRYKLPVLNPVAEKRNFLHITALVKRFRKPFVTFCASFSLKFGAFVTNVLLKHLY